MSAVPRPILDYWRQAFAGTAVETAGGFALSVAATLNRRRPAMILERADEPTIAAIAPDVAAAIGRDGAAAMTIGDLRHRLAGAGVVLHDPDILFYPPRSPLHDAARDAGGGSAARRLTPADRAAFDAFLASTPEQDRGDAFVELDHWAVFGRFDGDRLVSAASAILWDDGPIADLGVLTLPDERGRGHGRAAVASIIGFVHQRGRQPQYRCQTDNRASVRLATACGLAMFGAWTVGERQA